VLGQCLYDHQGCLDSLPELQDFRFTFVMDFSSASIPGPLRLGIRRGLRKGSRPDIIDLPRSRA
jgi:hypothetical protein